MRVLKALVHGNSHLKRFDIELCNFEEFDDYLLDKLTKNLHDNIVLEELRVSCFESPRW